MFKRSKPQTQLRTLQIPTILLPLFVSSNRQIKRRKAQGKTCISIIPNSFLRE